MGQPQKCGVEEKTVTGSFTGILEVLIRRRRASQATARPTHMLVTRERRAAIAVAGGLLMAMLLVSTGGVRAAFTEIARFLSLQGDPEPASANVLSEHEIEALDGMPVQSQAELLLERSINHYRGANEQIGRRVADWRGKIALNDRLNNLFMQRSTQTICA
jgi:hypothetical protein